VPGLERPQFQHSSSWWSACSRAPCQRCSMLWLSGSPARKKKDHGNSQPPPLQLRRRCIDEGKRKYRDRLWPLHNRLCCDAQGCHLLNTQAKGRFGNLKVHMLPLVLLNEAHAPPDTAPCGPTPASACGSNKRSPVLLPGAPDHRGPQTKTAFHFRRTYGRVELATTRQTRQHIS
jgi:hypothetical protein